MLRRFLPVLFLAAALAVAFAPPSPAGAGRVTDRATLRALAQRLRIERRADQGDLFRRLAARTTGPQGRLNRDPRLRLMAAAPGRVPRFYFTDNVEAAVTVGTDLVWPGGATGYALDGSGTLPGELCEWDANGVRLTHQEFGGRVAQMDTVSGLSSHSTHVAGTLVAAGVYAPAQGMSFAGTLDAYDWWDDSIEMAEAAASGMLASNHSYGYATGWLYNLDGSGAWFWFGDTTVSTTEDYGFGFYDQTSADWDQIAFDAPNYLIVKAAGNDRNDPAPAQPDSHYVWAPDSNDWVWSMAVHDRDGAPDGYDTVTWMGVAKNILTVGAVNGIASGYSGPGSVVMSAFSGWGPCDDGRIKPDIVGDGVGVVSCTATSNSSYAMYSGTSMATPNVAGSVNLLSHFYRATHGGATPRSATVKAIVLHTADEAGSSDGPDYSFGWGLLDTRGAADLIAADSTNRIREETLLNGATDEYVLQHPGGDLKVTIVWTDPPGTPPAPAVDPPDPMLVDDLDLRVEEVATTTTYMPWVLDPSNPANPATHGDNTVDNVEQVFVAAAPAGEYRVRVSHKGTLAYGTQDYSIVASSDLDTPQNVSVAADGPAAAFAIVAATPNPFRAATRLEFTLPERAQVAVGIYDLSGRRVRDLGRQVLEAGRHGVTWDGRDARGTRLPAGVYFARVSAGGAQRVQRLVRMD